MAYARHEALPYGFMKGKSFLTNLIFFKIEMTCSVDEGKDVDVVYPDFSKTFDAITHSMLLEKWQLAAWMGD